jgi:hypothetical protein
MQNQLLGPDGRPISSSTIKNKKADPPKLGTSFGDWAGRDLPFMTLPGGGVVQFDLSKLTLADFRGMRDHYQVNSSLAVLSFMQHQSDFHVECEDNKIADFCDEQLHDWWTALNRSMSQANSAGYSPNAIEWDNDYNKRSVVISKVKDLVPEECRVEWKLEEGWAPPGHVKPKFKVYNGIKQIGSGWPIPVDNSFWYPLLMENGDYYGRKLLRPAFQSWFFSILLHLFANRYYERFGEPVPVGRAPFDESIEVDGTDVAGNSYMLQILQALRSRAAVVLPNSRTEARDGKPDYDYAIEYLESQMRGADFERYMTRLDEEISIGMFTPILLLRTADVGSYNLGQGHMQMYLWMLNAMNADRKVYIDNYILSPMVNYNFSENAPRAKIVFRKLGNIDSQVLQSVLTALIQNQMGKPDLKELGQMVGMTLEEVQQTVAPPPAPAPATDPAEGDPNNAPAGDGAKKNRSGLTEVTATGKEIANRVRGQVEAAFRENRFGKDLQINMGYKRKFERALDAHGVRDAIGLTNRLYSRMDNWCADVTALGESEFSGPDSFMGLFDKVLNNEIEAISASS